MNEVAATFPAEISTQFSHMDLAAPHATSGRADALDMGVRGAVLFAAALAFTTTAILLACLRR